MTITLNPGKIKQVNATLTPLITIDDFHFTEVVENHLPEYVVGWAEAYCPGEGGENSDVKEFWYRPPSGYEVVECMHDGIGSHGGCPGCAMRRVKCVKIVK